MPFGPGEDANTFTLLGSQYRGFPVIKVCSLCKLWFQSRDFAVRFTYKEVNYIGINHTVKEARPDFWEGGTTDLGNGTGTMIMRTVPGEQPQELVAVVADEQFLNLLIHAPALLDTLRIVRDAFSNEAHLFEDERRALSHVRLALRELEGEA
jgi:hypothetical protein